VVELIAIVSDKGGAGVEDDWLEGVVMKVRTKERG
jgi:hypothetical protein